MVKLENVSYILNEDSKGVKIETVDLEGICRYINIEYTETLKKNYLNPEKFKSTHLSTLFKKGKVKNYYKKGDEGFLNSLDIEKIYTNCSDLKNGIEGIIKKVNGEGAISNRN
jgi:hypothetical protein